MRITKRQLQSLISEAMPPGGVPDVVGAVTGVPQGNIQNLIDEYKEWAVEYMGTPSGANSTSVMATWIVLKGLSEQHDIHEDMAEEFGFTHEDLMREIKHAQKEHDAGRSLSESARAGELMLIWNELQEGDLIDVDSDYNFYSRVRIIQKLEDVSRESGLDPGPGFIGKEASGDEIVFSVEDVDPDSYEKYAMAETKKYKRKKAMKITNGQLKSLIREAILEQTAPANVVEITSPEASEQTISAAWPDGVMYNGEKVFDIFYSGNAMDAAWSFVEREGYSDGQESYLGYDPDMDVFFMGFDVFPDDDDGFDGEGGLAAGGEMESLVIELRGDGTPMEVLGSFPGGMYPAGLKGIKAEVPGILNVRLD